MEIGFRPKDRLGEVIELLKVFITKVGNSNNSVNNRLLDINEAAIYLGVEKQTLYKWVCQRFIPFVKAGRLTKFDPKELDRWISKVTVKEIDFDTRY